MVEVDVGGKCPLGSGYVIGTLHGVSVTCREYKGSYLRDVHSLIRRGTLSVRPTLKYETVDVCMSAMYQRLHLVHVDLDDAPRSSYA